MAASQHRSSQTVAASIAACAAVAVLALAACGSATPPAVPAASQQGAAPHAATTERAVTLETKRGEVQARVRPDAQLPGQYVVAFTPGLREDIADAGAIMAKVVSAVAGSAPSPQVSFYSVNRNHFYLGDGAERYCVQVTRETENGGVVAMRFVPAADTPAPAPAKMANKAGTRG